MSCEIGVKKPDVEIFQKCMKDLKVVAEECIYVGDGGSFELETAQSLRMHPLQATWYLKDGVNQPAKRKKNSYKQSNGHCKHKRFQESANIQFSAINTYSL